MRAPSPPGKPLLLIGLAALVLAGVGLMDPIPQDPAYHAFADHRTLLGIPNALDVLSNLPFLLAGLAGLWRQLRGRLHLDPELDVAYAVLFAGVALTALGSGYYHLAPDNPTLVWDRLPMALTFMALVAVVAGEFIGLRLGRRLLWPLAVAGIGSVVWWAWTETMGRGDLRPYVLVQFLPMVLLPLVFVLYRSRWSHSRYFWMTGGWYVVAKVFEFLDRPVLDVTGLVSGHTLKHFAAALGALCLLRMLRKRSVIQHTNLCGTPDVIR